MKGLAADLAKHCGDSTDALSCLWVRGKPAKNSAAAKEVAAAKEAKKAKGGKEGGGDGEGGEGGEGGGDSHLPWTFISDLAVYVQCVYNHD